MLVPGWNPDGGQLLRDARQVFFCDGMDPTTNEEFAVKLAHPVEEIHHEVVDATQHEADRDHDVQCDKDPMYHSACLLDWPQ